VPDGAWHIISLNFIESLPRLGVANCILVIVTKFSKYSHFVPLLHPFTSTKVVEAFLHHVYKLHGIPVAIISDMDKIFLSHFWQELFKLAGVTLLMSSV
jgi:hypothetical protein